MQAVTINHLIRRRMLAGVHILDLSIGDQHATSADGIGKNDAGASARQKA